jgi:Domain of unknown function (DUF6602)
MTTHSARIRSHFECETEDLLLAAQRARLLDHNGSRGHEAEQGILRWLRRALEPDYTVSSGEIIDSFDTNADIASRQQDGIVHRNHRDTNRFCLPSGLRLVPIEGIAAVVEVKLDLNKDEFMKAEIAARETARLRLRPRSDSLVPTDAVGGRNQTNRSLSSDEVEHGIALDDSVLRPNRPTFAVFGFGGTDTPETMAKWLWESNTIDLVACLSGGCVLRRPNEDLVTLGQKDEALSMFAASLSAAVKRHVGLTRRMKLDFGAYGIHRPLPYWKDTGYGGPDHYSPEPAELERREEMFKQRPSLRR